MNSDLHPDELVAKKNSAYKAALDGYQNLREQGNKFAICHAPFKNLYFGHRGSVTACCYNRLFELGRWPEQSVQQIWNGQKANELRGSLKDNSLKKGCSCCEIQLFAKNFPALKAVQFDINKLNSNHFPSVFEFELDNTCNLECVMCSAEFSSSIANRKGRKPYESPYNEKFVEQLNEFIPYLDQAKFYGGEPFMIKVYYDIWDRIVAVNPVCRIIIQTNATFLNTRIRDLLEKGIFYLNISIDSLQKENYERIRVNANFEMVMEHIEYFHDYSSRKNLPFNISACMMKQNWQEAPEFVNYCNKKNASLYFHTVFAPASSSLSSLSKNEIESIIRTLQAVKFEPADTQLQKENIKHYEGFINQLIQWSGNEDERTGLANSQGIADWEVLYDLIRKLARERYSDITERNKANRLETYFREIAVELGIEKENYFPGTIDIISFSMEFENLVALSKREIKELVEKNIYR